MMSKARHKQLVSGLNGAALKVYDAVPQRAEWSITQIMQEMSKGGSRPNLRVVTACLDKMRNDGLVRETAEGWQKVPVRPAPVKKDLGELREALQEAKPSAPPPYTPPPQEDATPPETKEEPMSQNPPAAPAAQNTVDWLGSLSQRMNAMIAQHQGEVVQLAQAHQRELTEISVRHREALEDLAHEVADAAIEVQTQIEASEEELKSARELKALLKKIRG